MIFEPGSLNLRSWLNLNRGLLSASVLARVEFRSTLERRIRSGEFAEPDRAPMLNKFEANTASVKWVEVDTDVRYGTEQLLMRSLIRTLDAIQLSSALLMAHRYSSPQGTFLFIASDYRLLKAADAEGLMTWDPATDPAPIL